MKMFKRRRQQSFLELIVVEIFLVEKKTGRIADFLKGFRKLFMVW
jgi:hypothetical protein